MIFKKYDIKQARKNFPKRKPQSNKATYGRVLILAGSEGFWGAGLLAAASALRAGAGYVYWASHINPEKILLKIPEVLTLKISQIKDYKKFDAILVGPGLGTQKKYLQILKKLANHPHVIVDADMLTLLASSVFQVPKTWILTPHPGEMARLLKVSTKQVNKNRRESLLKAYTKYKCNILLKGYKSIVTNGNEIREIQSGNEALAKAGSGDVLGGLMVALLAQGMIPFEALSLACFIHGYAADLWVRKYTSHTLNPSDLKDIFPKIFKKLSR